MLNLGDVAETRRTFSKQDVARFWDLAGINQPMPDYVPEPLIHGMFSNLLGMQLPGIGTMYMKQYSTFARPAPVGTELIARVQIERLRPEKQLVNLKTSCVGATGELYAEGVALVMSPKLQSTEI